MSGGPNKGFMEFKKSIEGNKTVTAHNQSGNQATVGTVILNADNSNFTGTWNVTRVPNAANSSSAVEGKAANAFGKGKIDIGNRNIVYFSHAQINGNILSLATGAKAVMNTNAKVGELTLGVFKYTSGTFNKDSHPAFFEGTGTLTVDAALLSVKNVTMADIYFDGQNIKSSSNIKNIKVYTISGQCIYQKAVNGHSAPLSLNNGLYIVEASLDNENVFIKIVR
jgi:hypothetical protein